MYMYLVSCNQCISKDETKLDRILVTTRLDKLELLDLLPKQSDMSSQELLNVECLPPVILSIH